MLLLNDVVIFIVALSGRLNELDRENSRKKTWWDCVENDMESLGLSQKDAQSRNKWGRRIK